MARPKRSTADTLAMRDSLCAAALALYRQEGEAGLSLRRIADVAGCSHTLPYRYFANKSALLTAMRASATRTFERELRQQHQAQASPADQLRQLGHAYLAFVRSHPADYQLLTTPGESPSVELQAARESLFGYAQQLVEQAVQAGALAGDAATIAHLFWAGLHGLIQLDLNQQLMAGCSLDALLPELMDRLLQSAPG